MTKPKGIHRARAANRRLAWIGFGAALLVGSAFGCWVFVTDEAAREAAIQRANPRLCIAFSRGLLGEVQVWGCEISALAGVGMLVRGLMIRLPAA